LLVVAMNPVTSPVALSGRRRARRRLAHTRDALAENDPAAAASRRSAPPVG